MHCSFAPIFFYLHHSNACASCTQLSPIVMRSSTQGVARTRISFFFIISLYSLHLLSLLFELSAPFFFSSLFFVDFNLAFPWQFYIMIIRSLKADKRPLLHLLLFFCSPLFPHSRTTALFRFQRPNCTVKQQHHVVSLNLLASAVHLRRSARADTAAYARTYPFRTLPNRARCT